MSQTIEELITQAVSLLEAGLVERAEIEFRKILKLFPDHHLAIGALGDFYLQVGRPDLALPPLRRLVVLRPNDYLSHFLLGVAYGKVGRFFLSLKELKKANELVPNHPEIFRQLGINLGFMGEIKEGRKLLEQVLSLNPGFSEVYADLGANYMFNGEYEKAKEYLEKSLALEPENSTAQQLSADLKSNQAKLEKLSLAEKEKRQQEIQSPESKRQMRIDLMMYQLSQMAAAKEDLAEVMLEFKKMGLSGQITQLHDPNTPEGRAAIEYVHRHQKIKNLDTQKLSPKEMEKITTKLLAEETNIEEKKDLILILAHQGESEALKGLEKYAQSPAKELKTWIQLAVDECKSFLAGKILNEPVIQIHKIGKESTVDDDLEEQIKKL